MKKIIILMLFFLLLTSPALATSNLYEFYAQKDTNLPSISERAIIWGNLSSERYIGSREQNMRLLAYLEGSVKLGSNIPISAVAWYLAIPHSSTITTIDVSNFQDLRGNVVSDWPTKIYLTIEPDNTSNTEIVVCPSSGVDQTNSKFTSCTRGLSFSSSSEATVLANGKSHGAGSLVTISNPGQFFNNFVDIDSAQTVGGNKTFSGNISFTGSSIDFSDIIPTATTTAPTANAQLATKKYVDDTAVSGAPDGAYTTKGVVEVATSSEFAIGTILGETGARLVIESRAVASTTAAKTMIPATKSNGKLSSGFIDQTADYTFTGSVNLPPVGSIIAYASSTPPSSSWLACNGQIVSTSTYSALFALIKNTYGGVTGHTFALPDLSGRNIIGYGSVDPDMNALGETGGATSTLLTAEQSGVAAHTHPVPGWGDAGGGTGTTINGDENGRSSVTYENATSSATEYHSNMDPFIILQYIIKAL